jgi:hypothetical protein
MALSGAYAPASIALRVIWALRPPFHDKAVVLEEALGLSYITILDLTGCFPLKAITLVFFVDVVKLYFLLVKLICMQLFVDFLHLLLSSPDC